MCYEQYTRVEFIRTFRGQGFKGNAGVSFQVVDDDFQMIVEDINGIDKG